MSVTYTVEEVCKSFTDEQLIVLSQVFMQEESEAAQIVKSYVIYKVTFDEDEAWED